MHSTTFRAAVVLMALLLAACGNAHPDAGNAEAGRKLYAGEAKFASTDAPNCLGCHSVTAGESATIGPNLSNIGNRAATTVPGQDADTYLRTAILDPDAYLAGGFQEGIHYRGYKDVLTDQQVNDLIAYMLTLHSGQD